jgi:hypothetical protein
MDIDKVIRAFSGAMWRWGSLPGDDIPALSIHRCFQREAWREARWRDRLGICAARPFVSLVNLGLAAFFTSINGRAVKDACGKGRFEQLREQVQVANRFAIPPPWYYIFELHDDAKRQRASEFLNRWEMKSGLYRFLRDYNGGLPCPGQRSSWYLRDKTRFAQRCRQFRLPTVPVLLVVARGGRMPVDWPHPGLPDIDLFVKPAHGRGGKHAEVWYSESPRRFCNARGEVLATDDLLDHLLHAARRQALLIQPRLTNHPDLADLANGTLATVRVMSCRNERGDFEVTNAVLRMASHRGAAVDNFHAGGIAAGVDVRSGKLGPATGGAWGATTGGWFECHPETGAQIAGRTLPDWSDLIALVQRAHAIAFPDQVVIGWDVAALPEGPCLIEANKGPDLDIVQRVESRPIGNERLGRLIAFNLERAVAAKYARAGGPELGQAAVL